MEGAMEKTGGGLDNSCIWCLSNYAAVPESNGDNNGQLQLYRKKRYKLVLEYLLQNDTVHYTSDQHNEDQQRRHLLLQKLLEFTETERATSESAALYQLCPTCAGKADEVMRLHLALEVIQMKLADKISCLTEAVITNSMYGSNEVTKKRMQELEIWLQQQQEQETDHETEGVIIEEVGRLKKYMETLEQFQTLIFEGGSKLRSVPCVFLHKCMPISSFSGEEKIAIDCGVVNMNMTEDFINSTILHSNRPSPIKKRIKKAKLSKSGAAVGTSSKRATSRKSPKPIPKPRKKMPKQVKIAALEHPPPDEELNVPPTSSAMEWNAIATEDGLENQIKEEPNDEDLPPSPFSPDGFQFQEDPEQFLSQVDPQQATAEVVENEDPEQPGLGKRRRVKPVRFCPPNFNEPVYVSKPRQKSETGISKEQLRLAKGVPKHIKKMLRPKRSKLTERQRRLLMNRKKKLTEFPCSSCNFVGESSYAFIHHLRGHETEEKVFECKEPDCEDRHFSGKQFYDFHMKLHKLAFGLFNKCGICTMTVPLSTLTTHMKSHEGVAIFPCSNCYYCTNKLKDYLSHLKHHAKLSTLPEFTCPLCPKLFPKQRELISEITKHLYNDHGCNELLLKCEFKGCPATFLFRVALKNHYNIHLKRFKCDRCKEAFISNAALRSHVQTAHLKLKLFMCNIGDCLENFRWQAQLDAHQVQCHDFPKFKCEHCPIEFTNTDARRSHMRRIHHDKSYVCVTCGKGWPTIETLSRHETIHLERSVKCDQCDFVTKSKHHLKKHKNTQHRTAPKIHGCPHCEKRFNFKRAMEDHIRTHTGERPFVCHLCSVAFAKKQPLDNHIKKVHANHEKTDDAGMGTVTISKNPTDVIISVAQNASGTSTASYVAL